MRASRMDKYMWSVPSNVDLAYSTRGAGMATIRNIVDPSERMMAMIGYLDVENSPRYQNIAACNIFGLDLAIAALGPNKIGSMFNPENGEPFVAGTLASRRRLLKLRYPYLHSNNLDWWLSTYGEDLGWQQVTTQDDLRIKLEDGAFGLAVSSQASVAEGLARVEDERQGVEERGGVHTDISDYYGHLLCIVSGIIDRTAQEQQNYIISQATPNKRAMGVSYTSTHPKVCPEKGTFSFWVHNLPTRWKNNQPIW